MFVGERQNQILEFVNRDGKVKVKELSKYFEVTDDCIRKDLSAMEKKGLLKKAYGGAVRIDDVSTHPGHSNQVSGRTNINLEKKKIIAQKAVELIKDGDVIYLDTSTTNLPLAEKIIERKLRVHVVSPMLDIANLFATDTVAEFISTGGTYNLSQNSYMGMITMQVLRNFHFDLAFMGVVGANLKENEITTYMPEDGAMKNLVVSRSTKTYLMMENRKFEFTGNYKYASFDQVAGVICQSDPEPEYVSQLEQYKVDII